MIINLKRHAFVVTLIISAIAKSLSASPAVLHETDVFTSGSEGYAIFRIPTITKSQKGTLLGFAEGRKNNGSDTGDIDIVLKRSLDNGKSWSDVITVWDDGENTCGNACPVVIRDSGRILVVATRNLGTDHEKEIMAGTSEDGRRVFSMFSDDDGLTWSTPKDITKQVKKDHWRWYATGPVHGIQMQNGRVVIPANHSDHSDPNTTGTATYQSHIIYSDDAGDTWQLGGTIGKMTNESTVAELPDGSLVQNMRSYHGLNRRAVSFSKDGGKTWSGIYLDPELIEPVCQGALIRYDVNGKSYFAFTNPASKKRENLTLRISNDGYRSWNQSILVNSGFSAYSDMVITSNGNLGCFYESADSNGKSYGKITFKLINSIMIFND